MKKLYYLLILVATVLFISNTATGQGGYTFQTDDMGTAVMEAEHYTELVSRGDVTETTGSTWVDTSTTPEGYSGDGFMKAHNPGDNFGAINAAFENAGYLNYSVDFKIAGTYYIWARATHESGSDDSFHAALADGDNILAQVEYINFQGGTIPVENVNNWAWIYYSNPLAGAASVAVPAAGVFTFRVYIRERNFKIDKILLTLNMAFQPDSTTTGPEETLITGLESHTDNNQLLQVYPNPVTSSAMISYTLDKPVDVSINVYNVLGEEVSTLSDELQKAGRHEIRWDATNMSGNQLEGGLYFIKIKAGSETRTVKTMLAR